MQTNSPQELKYLLLNMHEPLIFKNKLNWPILNWNLEKWESILKDEELTFRCGVNAFTKEPQWERITESKKITFKEFLSFASEENKNWMYFDYKYLKDWFQNIEELNNSINWNSFGFPELTAKNSTVWIGSKGAHTPCHIDTYGWNLVAQIYGRKQWTLFPPEENLKPTRIPYEESSIYSKLNFFTPTINDFKGISNCRKIILNPGDVLFVPHQWWHFVENLDTAISVNVWLPSENDNEERLKESLVQLFISQVVKDIEQETKNVILNPTSDEELKNLTFDASLSLTNNCKNMITQSNKRICLNEQPHKKSDSSAQYLPEIDKYPFIERIPKLSPEEFELFLQTQKNRFQEDEKINISNTQTHVEAEDIIDLIDAFTHPEVISLVKTKLLK